MWTYGCFFPVHQKPRVDAPLDTKNHKFALIRLNLAIPPSFVTYLTAEICLSCSPVFAHLSTQSTENCSPPLCGTVVTQQRTACTVLPPSSRRFSRMPLLCSCTPVPASLRSSPVIPLWGAPSESNHAPAGWLGTAPTSQGPHTHAHPRVNRLLGAACAPRVGLTRGDVAPGGIPPQPKEGVPAASVS